MQDIITNRIYKDISEQTDINVKDINTIIQFMFKEVKDTMQRGDFQDIDLQYLGRFGVTKKNKVKLENRKKNYDRNIQCTE